MSNNLFGKIIKVTGSKISIKVLNDKAVNDVIVQNFNLNYITIGSLVGCKLIDGRILVSLVEEIYDNKDQVVMSATITGAYDNVLHRFTFGTNSFPLVGEDMFAIDNEVLSYIFGTGNNSSATSTIGTYIYESNVNVGYNPDILFGKHLGVFGNTGSGKTCTVVSIIQRYIRNNPEKDIKFIILDVNGEYKTAFKDEEAEFYEFNDLRFRHTKLSNPEYGKMFRAAEGIQYPALRDSISKLSQQGNVDWDLTSLNSELEQWISANSHDNFSKNQLSGYLRTLFLRIESILDSAELMSVINSMDDTNTLEQINESDKKIHILDLQVSSDSMDIVLYLFFKNIYQYKTEHREKTHINIVLEEAHRYINSNAEESKLGNYYIDKLSREGRKFGIGLIISSQVPSMLSYEIVSQCNSIVMHKITSKRDMDFLRGVLRISNDSFYMQMSSLEKQHAIICGEAFPNDAIIKVHDAYPLPHSADPVIRDLDGNI